MNETYLKGVRFWERAPRTYPDVSACIGTELGVINDRYWWNATGPARTQFSLVETEIREQLKELFTDRYVTTVHFCLYMIGRSEESAIPTIMFFCEEKEPRKKAKKTLDQGGLLEKLPGFRTGHVARQPGVGRLIQPATGTYSGQKSSVSGATYEVYYDTSRPIKAIGMPIFVKTSSDVVRRATANAVFADRKCVYLSVSHVFFDDVSAPSNGPAGYDSEYDFGSGTEDEEEHDLLNATSMASVSSLGEGHSNRPSSTTSKSASATSSPKTESKVSSPRGDPAFPSLETMLASSPIRRLMDSSLDSQALPPPESLRHLGIVKQHSVELDWAVIEISQSDVAFTVHDLKTMEESENNHAFLAHITKGAGVVAHTFQGPVNGRLTHDTVSMRLPNSTSFQEVHQVVLDSALEWGDCGVGILDAVTKEPYGHVVATSTTKEIAYIVPARRVFETSGTQWELNMSISVACPNTISLQGSRTLQIHVKVAWIILY